MFDPVAAIRAELSRALAPFMSSLRDAVVVEIRRQHTALILERDAALERATLAETTAATTRAALAESSADLLAAAAMVEQYGRDERAVNATIAALGDDLTRADAEIERLQKIIQSFKAAAKSSPSLPTPPSPPATKPTTVDVRKLDSKNAKRVTCPVCAAAPGSLCVGGGIHGERYALGRQTAQAVKLAIRIRCPACDAEPGTPCKIDGRDDLHDERVDSAKVPA